MFTGLVELLCPVVDVQPHDASTSGGGGYSITIGSAGSILDDCVIGDSIAVNGACLTVTEFDADSFKIGVAPETLKKTSLGELKVGHKVNCERAMKGEKRFGGHFVQGHVDSTALLRSVVPNGNALTLTLRLNHRPGMLPLPSELSPYLIPKGYITLDGASLTLIDVSPPSGGRIVNDSSAGETREEASAATAGPEAKREIVEFSVMLISHTQDAIGLSKKKPGETVNVELDMVGKYVHRSIAIAASSATKGESDQNGASGSSSLTGAADDGDDALVKLIRREVQRALSK
ncbi:unnamed protein product [Jaminaea pallidilutea]